MTLSRSSPNGHVLVYLSSGRQDEGRARLVLCLKSIIVVAAVLLFASIMEVEALPFVPMNHDTQTTSRHDSRPRLALCRRLTKFQALEMYASHQCGSEHIAINNSKE